MSELKLLIGSLSNDLFRVASLTQRGSSQAAARFLEEAKRWSLPISQQVKKPYIKKIALEMNKAKAEDLTIEKAERYLMYGVLLQNYTLHNF